MNLIDDALNRIKTPKPRNRIDAALGVDDEDEQKAGGTFLEPVFDMLSGGTTYLEPVFDAISSGGYAAAGAVQEIQKGHGVGAAVKRAGREFANAMPGVEIEGTTKPSFADVFKSSGVSPLKTGLVLAREMLAPGSFIKDAVKGETPDLKSNPNSMIDRAVTAAVGFGADVALDPTTYLGGPIIKGLAKGVKKIPGVVPAGERLLETGPIRALGKAFVKDFELDRAVSRGEIPKESVEGFKQGRSNRFAQMGEAQAGVAKTVLSLGANTTPEQRQVIGLFLDQPGKLESELAKVASGAELETLKGKANAFRAMFKDMAESETSAGLLSPTQIRSHYLRGQKPVTDKSQAAFDKLLDEWGIERVYDVADDVLQGAGGQIGRGVPGFAEEKGFQTIESRVRAAVPTELDIALGATQRGLESARQVATRRFIDSVLSDTGISRRVEKELLDDPDFMADLSEKGYAIYNPKRGDVVYALPKVVVDELAVADDTFADAGKLGKMLDLYDGFLNNWKGYALLSPSWHGRNIFGNLFNSWLGGVSDLGAYKTALSIQQGKPVAVKVGDAVLSNEQVMALAKENGVVGEGLFASDIPRSVERQLLNEFDGSLWQRVFGGDGAILKANRWLGSHVEDNQRMGHFIGRLQQGDSVEQAAKSVNTHLFDYRGGLTDFEQDVMKRLMPFYSWAKFNTVLQMQAILRDPGKYAKIPKLKNAIESMSEEWETNEPDFFDEVLATRLPVEVKGKPAYVIPPLPAADLNRWTWPEALSSLTPFVSAAASLAGKNLFTGRDIPADQEGVLLPTSRRVEAAVENMLPPLGRVNRMISASKRGDADLELLAQGAGIRVMPVSGSRNTGNVIDDALDVERQKRGNLIDRAMKMIGP